MSRCLFTVTEEMLCALTGCERILKTPLPPGYVGVLRILLLLFLSLLPFSLAESLRWGVIPVCCVASYILLEVEETAVQIEQPFGFEYNDLPLDVYCLTVQADVLRLLDESRMQARRQVSTMAAPGGGGGGGGGAISRISIAPSAIPRWTQQEEEEEEDENGGAEVVL